MWHNILSRIAHRPTGECEIRLRSLCRLRMVHTYFNTTFIRKEMCRCLEVIIQYAFAASSIHERVKEAVVAYLTGPSGIDRHGKDLEWRLQPELYVWSTYAGRATEDANPMDCMLTFAKPLAESIRDAYHPQQRVVDAIATYADVLFVVMQHDVWLYHTASTRRPWRWGPHDTSRRITSITPLHIEWKSSTESYDWTAFVNGDLVRFDAESNIGYVNRLAECIIDAARLTLTTGPPSRHAILYLPADTQLSLKCRHVFSNRITSLCHDVCSFCVIATWESGPHTCYRIAALQKLGEYRMKLVAMIISLNRDDEVDVLGEDTDITVVQAEHARCAALSEDLFAVFLSSQQSLSVYRRRDADEFAVAYRIPTALGLPWNVPLTRCIASLGPVVVLLNSLEKELNIYDMYSGELKRTVAVRAAMGGTRNFPILGLDEGPRQTGLAVLGARLVYSDVSVSPASGSCALIAAHDGRVWRVIL